VEIGDNVWVAAGAILLPGTNVGENSVIGAAAVCMRSFPANKVILGNPAKVAMPIPSIDDREPQTAEGVPVPEREEAILSQ
jgi:acetyltransferase-like isoleucine patch superfamily enzyme